MSYGIPKPKACVGKKGLSGRKPYAVEVIEKAKVLAYKDILKELLPDKLLAEKHLALLTTPKKIKQYIKGELVLETEELDTFAISKGLDMAYKLKGEYAEKNPQVIVNVGVKQEVNFQNKAKELKEEYEDKMRKVLFQSDES